VEFPVLFGTRWHIGEHVVLAAIGEGSFQAAQNIVAVLNPEEYRPRESIV
jgi:hypothetical protein